jgi:hypothetical protein
MFAAALILAISLIGGLLAWAVTDQFDDPLEAIWWSFLRLSDPGYLGDDEGVSLRIMAWAVTDQFDDPLEAIWWSFLRLSDPGYLGDDEGVSLRIISTIVTVLGYVLFLGSLVAIMTQWLNQTLRRYESGLTPISMSGHVVIIGRTSVAAEVCSGSWRSTTHEDCVLSLCLTR